MNAINNVVFFREIFVWKEGAWSRLKEEANRGRVACRAWRVCAPLPALAGCVAPAPSFFPPPSSSCFLLPSRRTMGPVGQVPSPRVTKCFFPPKPWERDSIDGLGGGLQPGRLYRTATDWLKAIPYGLDFFLFSYYFSSPLLSTHKHPVFPPETTSQSQLVIPVVAGHHV